jgi:ArsR family transcriptional regulator
MTNKDLSLLFKALSDENRLTIIELLINGETCGCKLIEKLSISQPTLSYHMNFLMKAKLVSVRKDGTWKRYRVDKAKLDLLIGYLNSLEQKETLVNCGGETNR